MAHKFYGDVYLYGSIPSGLKGYIIAGHRSTKTLGTESTAEGSNTDAVGNSSHAEGQGTLAFGFSSHAEGRSFYYCPYNNADLIKNNWGLPDEEEPSDIITYLAAVGSYSHAEGNDCLAYGDCSHAEGIETRAIGIHSHSEGSNTIAIGWNSHAEGSCAIAFGSGSHAEGLGARVTGVNPFIIPTGTDTEIIDELERRWKNQVNQDNVRYDFGLALGRGSHIEGYACCAKGENSHAEGNRSYAKGNNSHAGGDKTEANADNSVAMGNRSEANGWASFAMGNASKANGYTSCALGNQTEADGQSATAIGNNTYAKDVGAFASGSYTEAYLYQTTIGRYNVVKNNDGADSTNKDGTAFIIGNGTYSEEDGGAITRSNAFRVDFNGTVYSGSGSAVKLGNGSSYAFSGAYNSSGADYAEIFEWFDLNTKEEDRRGYFITLIDDKIKIAQPGDYVLGITSCSATVLGNNPEDWNGRYIHDEFGCIIIEEYTYEVKTVNPETNEEIIETKTGTRYKQNPDYDPTKPYIERDKRPEWAAVGMLGVLHVRDDGTCQVNGYCKVADGGIATAAESGYRVIARTADNVIKVVFK